MDTPLYATVARWCELTSMGRRVTYDLLGRGVLQAVKRGTTTLIDVEAGLAYLRSLPPARIKPMPARKMGGADASGA